MRTQITVGRLAVTILAPAAMWIAGFSITPLRAADVELKPEAVQGYERYIRLSERRMEEEVKDGGAFLRVDGMAEPRKSDTYARLQRGEVVSEKLTPGEPATQTATPGALIHHWVGTIFIPGATLAQVLALVRDYDHHSVYYTPDVMQSRTIEHAGDDFRIFYRLRKKKVITVILDADFDVHYHALGAARAYSDAHSTRIAQVENAGMPDEHALPPGRDNGFLWRLDTYWRYFDTGRGVYMQCEAISLTRDIPQGLGWLIGPMVESLPKESLEFTLEATRKAITRATAPSRP